MTVISPADPIETALATRAILEFDGPVYMRTGRSPAKRIFGDDHRFEIGKGQIIRDGSDVTLVACGVEVARALEAAELLAGDGIAARVVNMPTIKPIDAALLGALRGRDRRASSPRKITTSMAASAARWRKRSPRPCPRPIEFVGVRDTFGASGEPEELADHFGISARYHRTSREARRARASRHTDVADSRFTAETHSSPAAAAASAAPSRSAWRRPARDVALTYRERSSEADAVVREIESNGGRALALQMDVTDRASVEAAARDAKARSALSPFS